MRYRHELTFKRVGFVQIQKYKLRYSAFELNENESPFEHGLRSEIGDFE